ncbi:uncharacterized protein LOC112560160 isoform X1 [Pomacea canaliculata]|uniref:uncharacterized protein LOC112560160 isoform X1 n=1 Tax=Pomacea canaliculata TaxID=400727 RepID=UPI000D7335D1|nr:uncharacterized protein LOC112560160 isoform X1 [Pomacea canaliculata]XP_025087567.1 uncharacterized protein LOC112560160 isoform X1 [Pomacea canaliculata]XP_025087568.1 uncharacterized protein LOC112560160 isoform X1 [Pomacea canaliculata]XP_025087569.1 uncharacterized protein LOC112560160 isoform X1 [Pomacea canaliculata]XP_025087570.1 uncharacterized protein LOC112560160 isoform X1 [Pomacea canaliculata]
MTLKRETPAPAHHTVNTTKKKKNLVSLLTLERVKRRWQKAVQVVITVQRVAGIAEALRHPDHAKTFIDITEEEYSRYRQTVMGTAFSSGLTLKETMLSHHVCRILSTPPVHRSDEDIRKVVNGLRFIREFTAYPPHVQTQLARIGWYCKVQPNRIIIRQGQPPDACYFILGGQGAGSAVQQSAGTHCGVENNGPHVVGTWRGLPRHLPGPQDSSQHHPRPYQVSGEVDLMKGWPMSELYDNPSYCRTLYFRKRPSSVQILSSPGTIRLS